MRTPKLTGGYCDVEVAAAYYGTSSRTVRRWIYAGLLPAERLGPRVLRIKVADLDLVGEPIRTADAA